MGMPHHLFQGFPKAAAGLGLRLGLHDPFRLGQEEPHGEKKSQETQENRNQLSHAKDFSEPGQGGSHHHGPDSAARADESKKAFGAPKGKVSTDDEPESGG